MTIYSQEQILKHSQHQFKNDNNKTQEDLSQFYNDTKSILNVHIISHSHDDVGFVKTFDQYYYGYDQKTVWAGVRYTLDTVIAELLRDPTKKFTYVEMAFFKRWWDSINEKVQEDVRTLIANDQLQIVNGGWVMNDEACTYYEDIIDQMTLGHKFLKQTFDLTPNIGWHIDPFGHSRSQPYLFSLMGFDAWIFCRIDIEDQVIRLLNKQMEFVWHAQQDTSIFTSITFYHYGPPPGFDFDVKVNNQPIVDDPESDLYNVEKKSKQLVAYLKSVAMHYRGSHIMQTFGGDFQYGDARINFANIDTLIQYINSHQEEFNINLFYSTPGDYIKALHQQGEQYTTNAEDFFPYRDAPWSFWTGFYTSRVALKGMLKEYGRYIQKMRNYLYFEILNGRTSLNPINYNNIQALEKALGVLQHHDSVTGTCRQEVADNYVQILNKAIKQFHDSLFTVMKQRVSMETGLSNTDFSYCYWNVTAEQCQVVFESISNNKPVFINVYNPIQQQQQIEGFSNHPIIIKVPRNCNTYKILDQNNQVVLAALLCANATDNNDCELYFNPDLKPLSFNYFLLVPNGQEESIPFFKEEQVVDNVTYNLGTYNITFLQPEANWIQLDEQQGSYKFSLLYKYYPASASSIQPSGVYIFRPTDESKKGPIPYSRIKQRSIYKGFINQLNNEQYPDFSVVRFIGDNITTYIKTYSQQQYLEIETFVDSINIDDNLGKEVVVQINTEIQSNATFYTDSNGLEMQKRVRNHRPQYKLEATETNPSNYYPVTTAIKLEGPQGIFIVENDRSQGGTSLFDGQVEIMLHRRLLHDDKRGMGQPLNETDWDGQGLRQKMRHYLIFTKKEANLRQLQFYNDMQPVVYYSASDYTSFGDGTQSQMIFNLDLPPQVKIYLIYWEDDKYLLRLHNLDEEHSTQLSLDDFELIEEVTLTGNQNKDDWLLKKMHWNEKSDQSQNLQQEIVNKTYKRQNNLFKLASSVTLKPMEIRAFKVSYKNYDNIEII